jgi:hypothetical protein
MTFVFKVGLREFLLDFLLLRFFLSDLVVVVVVVVVVVSFDLILEEAVAIGVEDVLSTGVTADIFYRL